MDDRQTTFAYQRIYRDLRKEIESGKLAGGTKLPALRTLAKDLGVARNTVEAAYRLLLEEGYVRSRKGSGYFVEELSFAAMTQPANDWGSGSSVSTAIARRDTENDRTATCRFNFSYGDKDPGSFPNEHWKPCVAKALELDPLGSSSYSPAFGLWELRLELARKLRDARGVRCSPEQVVILPGTQVALATLMSMFDIEERVVCMEDPGYYAARDVFEALSCQVKPVPVHKGTGTFVKVLDRSFGKFLWLTPSHQFPLGSVMPLKARIAAIGWARARNAYIIEDDYCCEFRYVSKSVPSLHSLDTSGRVIYLGCMSKIISPALRISYMVLPPPLVELWHERSPFASSAASWIDQKALSLFMSKGKWSAYVKRTVNQYRIRHDLLVGCLRNSLGSAVDIVGTGAGQHVLIGMNDDTPSSTLIEAALEHDVRVYSIDHCWASHTHPMRNYVLVGYSSIDNRLIPEGVERLKRAWLS